jgi:hypothetical protein
MSVIPSHALIFPVVTPLLPYQVYFTFHFLPLSLYFFPFPPSAYPPLHWGGWVGGGGGFPSKNSCSYSPQIHSFVSEMHNIILVDKLDKSPWEEVRKEMVVEKGLDETTADR